MSKISVVVQGYRFSGGRMAGEAIRAKLSKGDTVTCLPWDAPSVELTAGEGDTGMYSAFMQNIPEAKFTSLILLHEMVTQSNRIIRRPFRAAGAYYSPTGLLADVARVLLLSCLI